MLRSQRYKIKDDYSKIYCLHDTYKNLADEEKNQKLDILEKIRDLQNNLYDTIWNYVYEKKHDRVIEKPKTSKEKNIVKYLNELKKIADVNNRALHNICSDVRSLINVIEDKFNGLNEKLYKAQSLSIKGTNQIESNLGKFKDYLSGEIRKMTAQLSDEQAVNVLGFKRSSKNIYISPAIRSGSCQKALGGQVKQKISK